MMTKPSCTVIAANKATLLVMIMTLFLVWPNFGRQASFFVQGRAATAQEELQQSKSFLRTRKAQELNCGCQDCTDEIWNLSVQDYGGDYTCGARIEWVVENQGLTEEEACIILAANEFPAECGKECNPLRCDGRNEPYVVPDDEPIVSGELEVDADMYCYPKYNARTRWTNVWQNNFIMEVKETKMPLPVCDPGANLFSTQTVSFDGQDLKLEFKKVGEGWMGAEVRLVLPQQDMPFHYGTYEWSVKSVQVINEVTGAVVGTALPPRIVLGLFTWDTTEDFAIRENRNHEVDIEISQFGDIGGPDVNFLVQPPGKPQQAKLYSGGSTSYDQSGHTWKFDWGPNKIDWYSSADGGISHTYSSDIILDYASPPWLQCMPADVEIRMNLWSLDGTGNQLQLNDDERIEVIIDSFSYQKSGETHVPDGGSCVKHCQCSSNSECDAGTCKAVSTSDGDSNTDTTDEPDDNETDTTDNADTTGSAACSAHPDCAHLADDCCPNASGDYLYCCTTSESQSSQNNAETDRNCSAHPACSHLAGMCCPSNGPNGRMLDCCYA